jgi:hypothetical protein
MERRAFLKSAAAVGATAVLSRPESAAGGVAGKQENPSTQEHYPLGPDSKTQPGVPIGKIFNFSIDNSRFFPGTHRTIDVYIPAQSILLAPGMRPSRNF